MKKIAIMLLSAAIICSCGQKTAPKLVSPLPSGLETEEHGFRPETAAPTGRASWTTILSIQNSDRRIFRCQRIS